MAKYQELVELADGKIIEIEGILKCSSFDKSYYSEGHDIPAVYIGSQMIAVGDGYEIDGLSDVKDEEHLIWKLEEGKKYRITIEEL